MAEFEVPINDRVYQVTAETEADAIELALDAFNIEQKGELAKARPPSSNPSTALTDVVMGGVKGAFAVPSTVAGWFEKAGRESIFGADQPGIKTGHQLRMGQFDDMSRRMGADPDSLLYGLGDIGGEVATTWPVPGAMAKGVLKVVPKAVDLANAIRTGGFTNKGMGTNIAGGVIGGAGVGALTEPSGDSVTLGAGVGGVIPPVSRVLRTVGQPIAAEMFNSRPAQEALVERWVQKGAGDDATRSNLVSALRSAQPALPGQQLTAAEALANAGGPRGLIKDVDSLSGIRGGGEDIIPNVVKQNERIWQNALNPVAGGGTYPEQMASRRTLVDARAADPGADYKRFKDVQIPTDETLDALMESQTLRGLIPSAERLVSDVAAPMKARGEPVTPWRLPYPKPEGPVPGGLVEEPDMVNIGTMQALKSAIDKASRLPPTAGGIDASSLVAKGGVREELINWLRKSHPEWGAASDKWAELSVPINQMDLARYLRETAGTPQTGPRINQFMAATEPGPGQTTTVKGANVYPYMRDFSGLDQPTLDTIAGMREYGAAQKRLEDALGAVGKRGKGPGEPPEIPHAGRLQILTDVGSKLLTQGGGKTKKLAAEYAADARSFADILKGLPDNKRLELLRQLITKSTTVGGAEMGAE